MATISQFMTDNHHHCDDLFAAAENAAADGNWASCAEQFRKFAEALEHHFRMEETVLFPAFEQQTGMTMGPTEVMRNEHAQMRDVLGKMAQAVAQQNGNSYLGHSETLLILMQQHNIKEESVLYPMTDQALGARSEALIGEMTGTSKAA